MRQNKDGSNNKYPNNIVLNNLTSLDREKETYSEINSDESLNPETDKSNIYLDEIKKFIKRVYDR